MIHRLTVKYINLTTSKPLRAVLFIAVGGTHTPYGFGSHFSVTPWNISTWLLGSHYTQFFVLPLVALTHHLGLDPNSDTMKYINWTTRKPLHSVLFIAVGGTYTPYISRSRPIVIHNMHYIQIFIYVKFVKFDFVLYIYVLLFSVYFWSGTGIQGNLHWNLALTLAAIFCWWYSFNRR